MESALSEASRIGCGPMKLPRLLRGMILQPTATLTDVGAKATLVQAISIVAGAGFLLSTSQVMAFPSPRLAGTVMLLLYGVLVHLALWLVMALGAYITGRFIFNTEGKLRDSLLSVGLAYVPWVLCALLSVVLQLLRVTDIFFTLFFAGWFIALFVIGVRTVHSLSFGRSVFVFLVPGFLAYIGLWHLTLPRLFIYPLVTSTPPFTERWHEAPSWEALPPTATNRLANPDFEKTSTAPSGEVLPTGWRPVRSPWTTELTWQKQVRHGGEAAVVVRRDGLAEAAAKRWEQIADGIVAGREVFLSAWLRTEDASCALVVLGFLRKVVAGPGGSGALGCASAAKAGDGQGHSYAPAGDLMHRTTMLTGTHDWTNLRLRATAPEEATSAYVAVVLWGRGTLWADDVELFQVTDEAILPKQREVVDTDAAQGVCPHHQLQEPPLPSRE